MKKLIFALALVGLTTGAMAQEFEVPTQKYSVSTNSFWANWFVQFGGEFNAAYSNQENLKNVNPFSVDRGDFGFDLAVGKWFTPSIGLRTKFNIGWAKAVVNANTHHAFSYWNIHEDVMFNLSNMFCGYSETRVWNIAPYLGLGVMNRMNGGTNHETSGKAALSVNFGLYNSFRINDRFSAFADLWVSAAEGRIDGLNGTPKTKYDWRWRNNFEHRHWDKYYGISVGVSMNIGKTTGWKKTPDIDALMAMNKEQMDALNASLKEQQDENARLRNELANKKDAAPVTKTEEKIVKEFWATPVSVFFRLDQSKIEDRTDLVNIKNVVDYAKENNKKIVVYGYADSETGSEKYNHNLSEKRAKVVIEEIVKMGFDRDNIITEVKGGVDDLEPQSYNRRVLVRVQ